MVTGRIRRLAPLEGDLGGGADRSRDADAAAVVATELEAERERSAALAMQVSKMFEQVSRLHAERAFLEEELAGNGVGGGGAGGSGAGVGTGEALKRRDRFLERHHDNHDHHGVVVMGIGRKASGGR